MRTYLVETSIDRLKDMIAGQEAQVEDAQRVLRWMKEALAEKSNQLDWRRCEYAEAQQYRSRVLTGSIGLEGPWSEWIDGRPESMDMNREYEFRTTK